MVSEVIKDFRVARKTVAFPRACMCTDEIYKGSSLFEWQPKALTASLSSLLSSPLLFSPPLISLLQQFNRAASGTSLFATEATGEEEKRWTSTLKPPSVPRTRENGNGSSTSTFRQEDETPVSSSVWRNKLLQVTGSHITTTTTTTSTQVMQENSVTTISPSTSKLSTPLVNDTTISRPSVSPSRAVQPTPQSTFVRRPSFHPSSQQFHDFSLPRTRTVNRPDVKSDGSLSSPTDAVKKPLLSSLTDESTQSSDYNSNVKVPLNRRKEESEKSLSSSNHLTSSVKSDERQQQNTLPSKSQPTSQVDKQSVLHPYHSSEVSSSYTESSSSVKNVLQSPTAPAAAAGQVMNVPLIIVMTFTVLVGVLIVISRVNKVTHLISASSVGSSWRFTLSSVTRWRGRRKEKTMSQEELSGIELAASASASAVAASGDFTYSHSNKAFTTNESEEESEQQEQEEEEEEQKRRRNYGNGKRRR